MYAVLVYVDALRLQSIQKTVVSFLRGGSFRQSPNFKDLCTAFDIVASVQSRFAADCVIVPADKCRVTFRFYFPVRYYDRDARFVNFGCYPGYGSRLHRRNYKHVFNAVRGFVAR